MGDMERASERWILCTAVLYVSDSAVWMIC